MHLSKTIFINNLRIVLILILAITLFSCQSNNRSVDLLEKAQNYVDKNPKKSLSFLDSISDPKSMSQNHYMQFLLTFVHAKVKDNQVVTNDTAIFKVQKYFEEKNNIKLAASANFYAARVYYEQSKFDKAIEHYLRAAYYSEQSKDTELSSKIYNNIGYIYYIQDLLDNAITNYHKGLSYSKEDSLANISYSQLASNLALAYEMSERFDSAAYFFTKSKEISNRLKEPNLEVRSLYNWGVMSYQKESYDQSLNYFNRAISKSTTTQDSLRIYYMKSKLFYATNQMDSAKYHADIVNNRLSEISDSYVLEDFYSMFSDYNKKCGNYEEALKYTELKNEIRHKRELLDRSKQILIAEQRASMALLIKKQEKDRKEFYICISIIPPLLLLLVFLFRFEYLKYKKEAAFLNAEIHRITCLFNSNRGNKRLYEWADKYLSELPIEQNIKDNLSKEDLLLLALFCNGYSNQIVATILNIKITSVQIYRARFRKLIDTIETRIKELES